MPNVTDCTSAREIYELRLSLLREINALNLSLKSALHTRHEEYVLRERLNCVVKNDCDLYSHAQQLLSTYAYHNAARSLIARSPRGPQFFGSLFLKAVK
jgi:hypothetical protein